ncbi:hypothetical protein FACS1894152_6850 [Bacilli bacterium]|nr:hypothetical protein FACS1894152_6850 [Bacilli bacterium]
MTKRTVPPEKFLGVWIPRDIYLSEELSRSDKILLAEIKSLQKKKGCFAGNGYFARFLALSTGTIANMLTKLKRLNLMEDRGERNKRRLLFTTFDTLPEYSERLKEELKTKKTEKKTKKIKNKDRKLENKDRKSSYNGYSTVSMAISSSFSFPPDLESKEGYFRLSFGTVSIHNFVNCNSFFSREYFSMSIHKIMNCNSFFYESAGNATASTVYTKSALEDPPGNKTNITSVYTESTFGSPGETSLEELKGKTKEETKKETKDKNISSSFLNETVTQKEKETEVKTEKEKKEEKEKEKENNTGIRKQIFDLAVPLMERTMDNTYNPRVIVGKLVRDNSNDLELLLSSIQYTRKRIEKRNDVINPLGMIRKYIDYQMEKKKQLIKEEEEKQKERKLKELTHRQEFINSIGDENLRKRILSNDLDNKNWINLHRVLLERFGSDVYSGWLKNTYLIEETKTNPVIGCETGFMAYYLEKEYLKGIKNREGLWHKKGIREYYEDVTSRKLEEIRLVNIKDFERGMK